jgi:hypothetical protein
VTVTETGAIVFGLQYLWGWRRLKWRWWFHGLGPKMAQRVLAELESDSWDPSEWRLSAVTATHGSTEKESANERLNSATSRRWRDYCPSWVVVVVMVMVMVMVMVACDKVFEVEVEVEVRSSDLMQYPALDHGYTAKQRRRWEEVVERGKSIQGSFGGLIVGLGDDNEDGASGCEC